MANAASKLRLRGLTAQLIPLEGGVVIRRGAIQVKVDGERAFEVTEQIFKIACHGAHIDEIVTHFPEIYRPSVTSLIDFLISRKFLISCDNGSNSAQLPETPLDIFHWHFDPLMGPTSGRIAEARLGVVGVNALTTELLSALDNSNFRDIEIVEHSSFQDHDHAMKWNRHGNRPIKFEQWREESRWKKIQCLIVCSDVGGGSLLHELNQLCISHSVLFFPIVLRDLIGFIGPLIVPGETACYECMSRRENSHLNNDILRQLADSPLPTSREVIGLHPTMYSIVANLAAFELVRFFSRSLPRTAPGTLIEINLLAMALHTRRVLKIPRCPSCSSMMTTPSISPYRQEAADGARETA